MNLGFIISLISGAVGGNLTGTAMKNSSLGPVGNSLVGILGGAAGGSILQSVGASGGTGLDIGALLVNVLVGGASGGVLTAIVGLLKGVFAVKEE